METERLPRRLAAILYADVAGYSRLTGEDEDRTHRALASCLDRISEIVNAHHGQVMHYAGDAVLARFDAAVNALACAVKVQEQVNEGEVHAPVKFRVGVNLGDVIEDRGDIYGDGVNVAARLEGLAEPGGICVSEAVRAAVGNKLGLVYEPLGEQRVKNIEAPVRAWLVRTGPGTATAVSRVDHVATLPDHPFIAVLPFANASGTSEYQYFADGITEDIITGLGRFHSLSVLAPGSAFEIAKRKENMIEAALEIGARYAVEGSVRYWDDQVRVTAHLIDSETGRQIWGDKYDRDLVNVFSVQDEIAECIVGALAVQVEVADHQRALAKPEGNLSAYDLLLRGRHLVESGTHNGVMAGRALLEEAIRRSPNYSCAHAWLSTAYSIESKAPWAADPDGATQNVLTHARRAVECDGHDSWARLMLADGYFRAAHDFESARVQLDLALELNPNEYYNYCFKSWFEVCAGNLDEGIACVSHAVRLNPLLPDGCIYTQGFAQYISSDYKGALASFGRMTREWLEVQACVAACYARIGRMPEARAAADRFRVGAEDFVVRPDADEESWRHYWLRLFPFKDAGNLDHLIDGMRLAGLPGTA